jgi:hypothetical protein
MPTATHKKCLQVQSINRYNRYNRYPGNRYSRHRSPLLVLMSAAAAASDLFHCQATGCTAFRLSIHRLRRLDTRSHTC